MSGTDHQEYRNRVIVDKIIVHILLQGNTTLGIDPKEYRDKVIRDEINISILLQGNICNLDTKLLIDKLNILEIIYFANNMWK